MPTHRRDDWHNRIVAVGLEFVAARRAADDLLKGLAGGAARPPAGTKVQDVDRMSENLEGTYLIRLFAAFESGLRSYWGTLRDTTPLTEQLIDSIATKRRIPDADRDEVHVVRDCRNGLVHERDQEPEPVALGVARGRLQKFFSRLPDGW